MHLMERKILWSAAKNAGLKKKIRKEKELVLLKPCGDFSTTVRWTAPPLWKHPADFTKAYNHPNSQHATHNQVHRPNKQPGRFYTLTVMWYFNDSRLEVGNVIVVLKFKHENVHELSTQQTWFKSICWYLTWWNIAISFRFPLMCVSFRDHTAFFVPNQVKQEQCVTWQHISERAPTPQHQQLQPAPTESLENVTLSLHRNVTLLPWYDAFHTHQETIFVPCAANNCISPPQYQQQQPPQQQQRRI